jgi:hypothetical protein
LFCSELKANRRFASLGARGEDAELGVNALTGALFIGRTMKVGSLVVGVGAGTLGYAVIGVAQQDGAVEGSVLWTT